MESLKKRIDNLQGSTEEETKKLSQEKANTEREFERLKEIERRYNEAIPELNDIRTERDNLKNSNNTALDELNQANLEIVNLKELIIRLEDELSKLKPVNMALKIKEENFDFDVEIPSFFELGNKGTGWTISGNVPEFHDKFYGIGILGNRNTGKSYIISRILSLENLLKDRSKGLGAKIQAMGKTTSIAFETCPLDDPPTVHEGEEYKSEGDVSVSVPRKNLRDSFHDLDNKIDFILAYLIDVTKLQVLVVEDFKYSDFVLLEKMKKILISNKKKKCYVIHNFRSLSREDEIKKKMEDFRRQYPKLEYNEDYKYYIDESDGLGVYHYIMAREGSEAAEKYNKDTITKIQHKL